MKTKTQNNNSKSIFRIMGIDSPQPDTSFRASLKKEFISRSLGRRTFWSFVNLKVFRLSFAFFTIIFFMLSILIYPRFVSTIDPEAMVGKIYASNGQAALIPLMNSIGHMRGGYDEVPVHDGIPEPLDLRLMTLDTRMKAYDHVHTELEFVYGEAHDHCNGFYAFDDNLAYVFVDEDILPDGSYRYTMQLLDQDKSAIKQFVYGDGKVLLSHGSVQKEFDSTVSVKQQQFQTPPMQSDVTVSETEAGVVVMQWGYEFSCSESEKVKIVNKLWVDDASEHILKMEVFLNEDDENSLMYRVYVATEVL